MTDPGPAPPRWAARAGPAVVDAAAFAVVLLAAASMEEAYARVNRQAPDADGARLALLACAALCALGLAGAVALLRRGAGWLLVSALAGLLFLYDRLEETWSRWGMNWEDDRFLTIPAFVGFLLFSVALAGLRRAVGPWRATQAVAHPAAFFLAPTLLFALSLLARLHEVAEDARQSWTSEHADPSLGAVAVLAALAAAAVAWRRRRA